MGSIPKPIFEYLWDHTPKFRTLKYGKDIIILSKQKELNKKPLVFSTFLKFPYVFEYQKITILVTIS